jgi:tRNA threonylcarbamoyladenosine modification (KEOPS) complex Cgi121 subunit
MASVKEVGAKNSVNEDSKLREAGFDPAAAPAEAIAKLEAMRGTAGVSDAAIVRALTAVATAQSAASLLRMETHAAGAARRQIRRALFKLRQHGIEAPATRVPKSDFLAANLPPSEIG